MVKSKILYLILLVCLSVFFILFVDNMSLLILILAVVLPFIQLFLLFSISRNISASLYTENETIHKNTESRIIVDILNSSLLPVSCAVATINIQNTLTGEKQTLTTMLPVSANNKQSIKFSVSYSHYGKIHITLTDIRIFDYFKLFSKLIKLNVSKEITVLPSLINISPEVQTNISSTIENDEFSKIKPGDDCSEIFNIREYAYGDKINRIHWNITTKLDNMMVKEYSLPVSSHIIILLEFCSGKGNDNAFSKADACIESVMALSYFMIQNNIPHNICWFDAANNILRTEKINCDDDFSLFIGSIFATGMSKNDFSTFVHHETENHTYNFSHTIYVSPVVSDEIFHNLSVLSCSENNSYLYINTPGLQAPEFFKDSDNITAIYADYNNIPEVLNKLII